MTHAGLPDTDEPDHASAAPPALHGVLVTYRRPGDLAAMFEGLAQQQRRLDTLVVIDNDPAESAREAVAGQVAAGTADGTAVTYVAAGANLGPAGGIALGMRHVLTHADDRDWLVPLDDDDPPRSPGVLAELERFATHLRDGDPRVGAVGLVGGRFSPDLARGVRIPDELLTGAVRADWVGSGNLPLYSVRAVRAVGVFDERLFFGFDDLEYGLRMGAAGFGLYAHGDLWHGERAASGRLALDGSPDRTVGDATWRRYYSVRNLLHILHQRGDRRGEARLVARSLGKPLANLPRHPRLGARNLALNARAIVDAYRGRMGLTVRPVGKS
jgi:GT2 family glycosyltransferase